MRGEPGLAVRARIVGDDVRGSLLRAMPHLAQPAFTEALEHFAAQVEQAVADAGEAGQSVDVELSCVMTPQGVHRANQYYRLAGQLLRAPELARDDAQAQARVALREADRAMRDPSHYVIRGVSLVLQSSVDAVGDVPGPIKETARVGSDQRRVLSPPASGGGEGALLAIHAGYGTLLDTAAS